MWKTANRRKDWQLWSFWQQLSLYLFAHKKGALEHIGSQRRLLPIKESAKQGVLHVELFRFDFLRYGFKSFGQKTSRFVRRFAGHFFHRRSNSFDLVHGIVRQRLKCAFERLRQLLSLSQSIVENRSGGARRGPPATERLEFSFPVFFILLIHVITFCSPLKELNSSLPGCPRI